MRAVPQILKQEKPAMASETEIREAAERVATALRDVLEYHQDENECEYHVAALRELKCFDELASREQQASDDETLLAEWYEWGEKKTAPKVDSTKFSGHSYDYRVGTSACKFGCGCWVGPYQSGGPADPFGACPNNPIPEQQASDDETLSVEMVSGIEAAGKLAAWVRDFGKDHSEFHCRQIKLVIRALGVNLDAWGIELNEHPEPKSPGAFT